MVIRKIAKQFYLKSLSFNIHFTESFDGQESWAMYHINKPEVKPMRWNKLHVHLIWITQDIELHCAISAFVFRANGSAGAWGSFFSFRSVPFQYVCSFRFGFSHKPKSKRPDGNLIPRASFPLTSGRKTRALGDPFQACAIDTIHADCALRTHAQ